MKRGFEVRVGDVASNICLPLTMEVSSSSGAAAAAKLAL